jgi:hypothetical protein
MADFFDQKSVRSGRKSPGEEAVEVRILGWFGKEKQETFWIY